MFIFKLERINMYNVFIVKISMHLPVKVRLELNLVYFCFVFLFIIIIFVLYMYHQMVLSKTSIRLITLYSFRENLRLSTESNDSTELTSCDKSN